MVIQLLFTKYRKFILPRLLWSLNEVMYKKHNVCASFSQFSRSVVSDSLQPHGLQHARLPCPSPTPGVYSDPSPLSQWCHPTISPSVVPFSSCLQSFSIRVFSSESILHIKWPKYWPFSFNISPSNEHSGLISFRMDLLSKGLSRVFSNTIVQKHQFLGAQLSWQSNSHIHTWPLEKPYPWPDGLCWQSNVSAF